MNKDVEKDLEEVINIYSMLLDEQIKEFNYGYELQRDAFFFSLALVGTALLLQSFLLDWIFFRMVVVIASLGLILYIVRLAREQKQLADFIEFNTSILSAYVLLQEGSIKEVIRDMKENMIEEDE